MRKYRWAACTLVGVWLISFSCAKVHESLWWVLGSAIGSVLIGIMGGVCSSYERVEDQRKADLEDDTYPIITEWARRYLR